MHSIQHSKWLVQRFAFSLMLLSSMMSLGLTSYVLAPLYSYYLFGNYKIHKNHKYFIPLTLACWRTAYLWLTDEHYRHMFTLPLSEPPLVAPDPKRAIISEEWTANAGDCNQCVQCCLKIKCPLLDKEKRLCLSYNTLHWRYFNCGRYPVSQKQLNYYECPKWKIS